MWLVHRFVTRPSKKSSKSKSGSTLNPVSKSTDAQASTAYSGDGTPVTRSASNIPTLSGTPRYANGAVHPSADSHANGNSPQDISRALLDAALKDTQAQEDGVLCSEPPRFLSSFFGSIISQTPRVPPDRSPASTFLTSAAFAPHIRG
jgi:hypothetical protein